MRKSVMACLYKVFAYGKNDVGQKPVDYFSLFHTVLGCIAYWIFFGILLTFPIHMGLVGACALMANLYAAVIWEIIENFILIHTKLKFGGRQDSLVNSLFDIVFTHTGAIFCIFMNGLEIAMLMLNIFIIGMIWRIETKKR